MLQTSPAFAKLSDRHALYNLYDGFPHFFHDAADGAARFIRTGALFVEAFADATDRGKSALNVPYDDSEGYFFWPSREPVAAGYPAPALHHPRGLQVVENLFQEAFGDVLLLGDGLNANDRFIVVQPKNKQCP